MAAEPAGLTLSAARAMAVPDDTKIFSDREIALILQKAAELQVERGGRVSGLSLEELRQVASEAGIEPHLVEDAVKELRRQAQPPEPTRRKSRKGQTRWEQSVELPIRLDNEDVRALLAHLEAEFGGHGAVTELTCGTVWTHFRLRDGHTHAAIEEREAGTRFHVAIERGTQRKLMRRVGGTIGAALFSIAGFATGDEFGLMFLTSLGIVAGNLTGRGMWRVLAPRWAGRLDRLVSTLSGEAMRNGSPLSATRSSASAPTAGALHEGSDR
jgi:hypothetical protein